MAPNQQRTPFSLSWSLNAVCWARLCSPTKSPLLSICKQLSSSCIIWEQAMPAPHCALPCFWPSAPAAQGSGCLCCYCCYYALPSLALLLTALAVHCLYGEECLLALIGRHGWTMTFGKSSVSFTLHQAPAVMADVGGSTSNTTDRLLPSQNNVAKGPFPWLV